MLEGKGSIIKTKQDKEKCREEHNKEIEKKIKKKEKRITERSSRTEFRRGRIKEHPEILDHAQVEEHCVTRRDLSRGRRDENGFREGADNA